MSLREGDPAVACEQLFAAAQLRNWHRTRSLPDNVVATKAWTSSVLPQMDQLRARAFIAFHLDHGARWGGVAASRRSVADGYGVAVSFEFGWMTNGRSTVGKATLRNLLGGRERSVFVEHTERNIPDVVRTEI